jgi:hypothetical protein
LTAEFKGYPLSPTPGELAIGDFRFAPADWTGASALHAWVKVEPTAAPLQGVRWFVISGTNFLYASVFDTAAFRKGNWNEMILPLQNGAAFDPASVIRVGIQILLKTADSPGIPSAPPTTYVSVDDLWVEK